MELTREMVERNNIIDSETGKHIDFKDSVITIPSVIITENGDRETIDEIDRNAFGGCKHFIYSDQSSKN